MPVTLLNVEKPGRLSFDDALALQERYLWEIARGDRAETLILLEHEPVYTIGKSGDGGSLGTLEELPHPVRTINRGGNSTYHGPGQAVLYALLNLRARGCDLHRHLRDLEEIILRTTTDFGVTTATRKDGLTGVWIGENKLASLGVGVRQWVTMHGLALNVTGESLAPFRSIIPCGLSGVQMTCLEDIAPADQRSAVTLQSAGDRLLAHAQEILGVANSTAT